MELMWEYLKVFFVGGALCVVGQLLIDYTRLTPARILTGYVVAGVILGALGVYEPVADFAGAGASVPISGFGYLMAQGAEDAVNRDGALGILTAPLGAAAAGIAAAIVFSVIAALITKASSK